VSLETEVAVWVARRRSTQTADRLALMAADARITLKRLSPSRQV